MKKSFLVVGFFVGIFGACTYLEPGDSPEREQTSDVNITLEFADAGEKVIGEMVTTEMTDGGMVEQQPNDQVISEVQTEPVVDVADGSVQPEPVAEVMQQEVMPKPKEELSHEEMALFFEKNACTQVGTCGAKPTNECDLTQWKFVIKIPPNCKNCSHKVESWPMGNHTSWKETWHTPFKDGMPVDHFNVILDTSTTFNLAHGISKMCHEHKCIKYSKSKHPDSTYKTSAQPTNWYYGACFPVEMSIGVKPEEQTWLYYVDLKCLKDLGCTY